MGSDLAAAKFTERMGPCRLHGAISWPFSQAQAPDPGSTRRLFWQICTDQETVEREIHHDSSLGDWLQRVRRQQPALINETVERLFRWVPETASAELLEQLQLIELLGLDVDCVAASVIEAGRVKGVDASPEVGVRVQSLAEGLRRLAELDRARKLTPDRAGAEGLRRLLLALVKDIRVVLVKLCQQLVQLRHAAKADKEVRRALARETSVIYAPLANRLGIWQLKWELEDLSFRYLEPETYQRIAKMLDQRRADRERYIQKVIEILGDALQSAGIDAEIAGRPKHIYSIWRKMQRKDVGFEDLFDIRAVRVLVDSIAECYGTLGVVHGLWQHIPGSSTTISPHPRRTTTSPCTPR